VREIDSVPRSRVVDVVALLVRHQAVIVSVVDALERQRRPQLIAFSRVVVDHVEYQLDAGGVELVHHFLELVGERRMEVAWLRREEGDRVVAPIVLEAFLDQITVIDKGVNRQQLRRGNAEGSQIFRHARVRQSGERAPSRGGNMLVQLGEALDVHLVHDGPLPRDGGLALLSPCECRIDHPALQHQRRAVTLVERQILVGGVEHIAEQLRPPGEPADDLLRVRIDQQLVGIEAMSRIRLVGSMHAISIHRPGSRLRKVPVPDFIGVFRQLEPLQLLLAIDVEKTELDFRCIRGEQGEIHTQAVPGRAEWKRPPLPNG
jgi:hypothetical protein